jgi:hypothetical protein
VLGGEGSWARPGPGTGAMAGRAMHLAGVGQRRWPGRHGFRRRRRAMARSRGLNWSWQRLLAAKEPLRVQAHACARCAQAVPCERASVRAGGSVRSTCRVRSPCRVSVRRSHAYAPATPNRPRRHGSRRRPAERAAQRAQQRAPAPEEASSPLLPPPPPAGSARHTSHCEEGILFFDDRRGSFHRSLWRRSSRRRPAVEESESRMNYRIGRSPGPSLDPVVPVSVLKGLLRPESDSAAVFSSKDRRLRPLLTCDTVTSNPQSI